MLLVPTNEAQLQTAHSRHKLIKCSQGGCDAVNACNEPMLSFKPSRNVALHATQSALLKLILTFANVR